MWNTHRTGTAQTTTSICTCGGKGLKRQHVLDRFELRSETVCVCVCACLFVCIQLSNLSMIWTVHSCFPSTHLTVHRTHSQLVHMTGQVVKDGPLVIADSVCNKIVAHDWPDGKRQCSDRGKSRSSIIARDSSLVMQWTWGNAHSWLTIKHSSSCPWLF